MTLFPRAMLTKVLDVWCLVEQLIIMSHHGEKCMASSLVALGEREPRLKYFGNLYNHDLGNHCYW